MSAPLFYLDSVPDSGLLSLTPDLSRHAVASMRVNRGETVLIGDGAGRIATCEVLHADRRRGLEIRVGSVSSAPRPPKLRVVQAIPKGERGDLAVELLTETGAGEIVPWSSARTVADWRGKHEAKVQRWRRVARAASMQARRPWVPTVLEWCPNTPEVVGQALVLHEDADDCLFDLDWQPGPVTLVVGPEGGLAPQEVEALAGQGAKTVNLGSLIMRTSTAGAAACVWIRGFEKRSRS